MIIGGKDRNTSRYIHIKLHELTIIICFSLCVCESKSGVPPVQTYCNIDLTY